ncbi:hypothetical protein NDU88_007456 [Pleurodeles waltl]|uniref:Uncharacterized protein n=1 Tax=Pleurodeles waltl TaxID=8319 RepID=A0AAV7PPZ2_PLEWA|nr:hypothetical protein NDU88_007456 [Pleurodeles waltl]
MGVPLAPEKIEGPSTKLLFLGIELDNQDGGKITTTESAESGAVVGEDGVGKKERVVMVCRSFVVVVALKSFEFDSRALWCRILDVTAQSGLQCSASVRVARARGCTKLQ